jgi:hypothetical protein
MSVTYKTAHDQGSIMMLQRRDVHAYALDESDAAKHANGGPEDGLKVSHIRLLVAMLAVAKEPGRLVR